MSTATRIGNLLFINLCVGLTHIINAISGTANYTNWFEINLSNMGLKKATWDPGSYARRAPLLINLFPTQIGSFQIGTSNDTRIQLDSNIAATGATTTRYLNAQIVMVVEDDD